MTKELIVIRVTDRPSEMKQFAVSFYVQKPIIAAGSDICIRMYHAPGFIQAFSFEEALGRGYVMVEEKFPPAEGFERHSVVLLDIGEALTYTENEEEKDR